MMISKGELGEIIILETQKRPYEGHDTPLGYHRAAVSMMAKGRIVA